MRQFRPAPGRGDGWEAVRGIVRQCAPLQEPYKAAKRAGVPDRLIHRALGAGVMVGALGGADACADCGLDGFFQWIGQAAKTVGSDIGKSAQAIVQGTAKEMQHVAFVVTHPVNDWNSAVKSSQGFLDHTIVGNIFATPVEETKYAWDSLTGQKKAAAADASIVKTNVQRDTKPFVDLAKSLAKGAADLGKTVEGAVKGVLQFVGDVGAMLEELGILIASAIGAGVMAPVIATARVAHDWAAMNKAMAVQQNFLKQFDPFTNGSAMQNLLLNPAEQAVMTVLFGLLMAPFAIIAMLSEVVANTAQGRAAFNIPDPFDPTIPARTLAGMIRYVQKNGDTPKNRQTAAQQALMEIFAASPIGIGTIMHMSFYVIGNLPIPGPAGLVGIIMSDPKLTKLSVQTLEADAQKIAFDAAGVIAGVVGVKPDKVFELLLEDVIYPMVPCDMLKDQGVTGLKNTLAYLGAGETKIIAFAKDLMKHNFEIGLIVDHVANPEGADRALSLGITAASAVLGGVANGQGAQKVLYHAAAPLASSTAAGIVNDAKNMKASQLGDLGVGPLDSITSTVGGLTGQIGLTGVEAIIAGVLQQMAPQGALARFTAGVSFHQALVSLTNLAQNWLSNELGQLKESDFYAFLFYLGQNDWYIPAALADVQTDPALRKSAGLGAIDFDKFQQDLGVPVPDGRPVLPKIASSDVGLGLLAATAISYPAAAAPLGKYLDLAQKRIKQIADGAETQAVALATHLSDHQGQMPSLTHPAFRNALPVPTKLPPSVAAVVRGPNIPRPIPSQIHRIQVIAPPPKKKSSIAGILAGAGAGLLVGGPVGAVVGGVIGAQVKK